MLEMETRLLSDATENWIPQQKLLQDLMGVDFDFVVSENDGWLPWSDDRLNQSDGPAHWELFQQAKDSGEPVLVELVADSHLLMIPFLYRCQTIVGFAVIDSSEVKWLRRLAFACLDSLNKHSQIIELVDENESFLRQVTENLEELTFLRQICQYLRITDAKSDLLTLSKELLELLNRSVQAEQLIFVTPQYLTFVGESVLNRQQAENLIKKQAPQIDQLPLIVNHVADAKDEELVRSFILAPMANAQTNLGWLMAVNRVNTDSTNCQQARWEEINSEFGTSEATLLASASSMLVTHMENTNLFSEKEQLLAEVVRSLVSAIEAKDGYTRGHSERVAYYGRCLAKNFGLSEAEQDKVYLSGLLHDVGKIAISDKTLSKPGKLTEIEFDEIRQHPEEGWAILNQVYQLNEILPGVLHHHERIDGQGYPDRLAGDEIPIEGRILAIGDAFDAMTSDRPYRDGMTVEKAVSIIREGGGTQWDAALVEVFLDSLDEIVEIRDSYTPHPRLTRQPQVPKASGSESTARPTDSREFDV